MLRLKNICKYYEVGEHKVNVLKGVDVSFGKSEFVAVLGPSGCGKTTLLNIIGGLDHPTDGEIVINGKSTLHYKDHDWDVYRNHYIGFVFQSYNLIPHLSVVGNVEMSMTLAGVGKEERRRRSLEALDRVGLKEYAFNKPNQLSGGQMQRVAIARSIVNDPDIILADEPTGALDSTSGVQVMELLKEISEERLVIMVTHNERLAEEYATRIIDLKDGVVTSDSNPYNPPDEGGAEDSASVTIDDSKIEVADVENSAEVCKTEKKGAEKPIKRSRKPFKRRKEHDSVMSAGTAFSLSFTNLKSKKGRTILTSFASSIGIIGIILVLALSGGAGAYIENMEKNALSQYPIELNRTSMSITSVMGILAEGGEDREQWPDSEEIVVNEVIGNLLDHILDGTLFSTNDLAAFQDYMEENPLPESAGYVKIDYGVEFDAFCNFVNDPDNYMKVNPFIEGLEEMMGNMGLGGNLTEMLAQFGEMLMVWDEMIDNPKLLDSQYELLGNSRWPTSYDEVVIVVNEENALDDYTLFALGLRSPDELGDALTQGSSFVSKTYTVDELLGLKYRLTTDSDYYYQDSTGKWQKLTERNDQRKVSFIEGVNSEGNPNSVEVKVVGVVRPKRGTEITSINGVIGYTHELTEYLSERAGDSPAVKAQQASPTVNILNGNTLDKSAYESLLVEMGLADMENPMSIRLYAHSFDSKEQIEEYIQAYNDIEGNKPIKYTDTLSIIMGYVDSLTGTITGVLVGFAAISLVVSSIMIAIIIYTSVLERRKEIGILRSLGARKKDISAVFIAESGMIGLLAGILGVVISFILFMPLNLIIEKYLMVGNLIAIEWWHVVMMILISTALSVIAGFIPSRIASRKDPVTCLRTE